MAETHILIRNSVLLRKKFEPCALQSTPIYSLPKAQGCRLSLSSESLSRVARIRAKELVWRVPQHRRICHVQAQAAKKNGNSGDKTPRYDPLFAKGGSTTECPVPWDQQPVNEYQNLNETGLFPWATDDLWAYGIRLTAVGLGISALVGYPVVALSINPEHEFLKCCMGALCGGVLASTVVALRLYLGWAYIGNRLFSATVEYEETGWYDGEVWVKPPEVLARDRLLGSYKVKPALVRLKLTLVGLGISLAALTSLMLLLPGPEPSAASLTGNVEDSQEIRSRTSGLKYSDAAARRFEPEAFAGEEDLSHASATLFDFCR